MLRTRAICILIILCAALLPRAAYSAGGGDPANAAADRDFAAAAAKADKTALAKLLDNDFMWIEADGKGLSRSQVLAAVPKPLLSDATATPSERYDYGQLATFRFDRGAVHVLRVWVKRPAGWRALVYQEVRSLDAPAAVTPGTGKTCENPCKSVQYTPKTEAEKAVISSYEALETAAYARDAAAWDAHTGEEFVAASSNSDKLLDKPTRMAELKRANMAGLAPTPLVSARLFEFGNALVMSSRHVPDRGKPLRITRVWVQRSGKWVETASFQTSIQGEAAAQ